MVQRSVVGQQSATLQHNRAQRCSAVQSSEEGDDNVAFLFCFFPFACCGTAEL